MDYKDIKMKTNQSVIITSITDNIIAGTILNVRETSVFLNPAIYLCEFDMYQKRRAEYFQKNLGLFKEEREWPSSQSQELEDLVNRSLVELGMPELSLKEFIFEYGAQIITVPESIVSVKIIPEHYWQSVGFALVLPEKHRS